MQVLQLAKFLPYRLNRISSSLSDLGSLIYRDSFDLTIPEWRTLVTVGEFGQASAKQICHDTAMDKTKVSRAVRSLERKKWLRRQIDSDDRRMENLTLTTAGKEVLKNLSPRMLQFEASIVAKLTLEEQKALMKGIKALELALQLPSRRASENTDNS